MNWSAKTCQGRVRPDNEDSYAVEKIQGPREYWVGVVADGLGGHEGGEIASSLAVKCVTEYLREKASEVSPIELLREAITYGNRKVFDAALNGDGRPGMGTTLTCALVDEKAARLYIGHVGDSRAYLISSGKTVQITEDHSVTGELVRNGIITEDDAMTHPGRNALTMALGTQEDVTVSTYEVGLNPGDVVLLCTDGLTSLVRADELGRAVVELDRDKLPDELVDLANRRGGFDNITVVLLWPDVFSGRGETA